MSAAIPSALLATLPQRFAAHPQRHPGLAGSAV